MSQPQHDDPLGEARAAILQGLAVAASVGEAAARFAAANAYNHATREEQHQRQAQAVEQQATSAGRAAQRAAAQTQTVADRRRLDLSFDQAWLSRAELPEVMRLWRTAVVYSTGGARRPAEAARHAVSRLRELAPELMDTYDQQRRAGRPVAQAMRTAAHQTWEGDPDQLHQSIQAEIDQLALDVDPDLTAQLERQWRTAGYTDSADTAARLTAAARANQLFDSSGATHGHAQAAQATVDIAATPVDERHLGLNLAGGLQADADQQAAAAMRTRLGRAFQPPQAIFSHPGPASTPTIPSPARPRGATR